MAGEFVDANFVPARRDWNPVGCVESRRTPECAGGTNEDLDDDVPIFGS